MTDKVALITGASSGIGRATAEAFATKGASVVVAARRQDELASLVTVFKFLSIVEPLGSLALLLGVLTRWAAAGLGIIMVGAIFFARLTLHAALFTTPQGTGLDYNLLILAGCIALIAFGAGGWSLDAIRKKALAQAAI